MNTRIRLLASLILLFPLGQHTLAADEGGWELVMRDRTRKIELDRASIVDAPDEVRIAWARVILSPNETRQAGYAIIKALNRFDCRNRTFTTVRRLYLDAELRALREEVIRNPAPVDAQSGVDERLWREVCKPPTVGELAQVAKAAEEAIAATPSPAPTAPIPVAPAPSALKPAAAPTAVAPAPVPPKPAATPASSPPARSASATAAPSAPAPPASATTTKPAPPAPATTTKPAASPAAATRQTPPPSAVSNPAASTATRAPAAPLVPETRQSRTAPAEVTTVPSTRPPLNLPPARPFVTTEPVQDTRPPRPPMPPVYTGGIEPPMWGYVRPEWRTCARGQAQSPIDLFDALSVGLEEPVFDYKPSYFRIENTGHTLMVRPGEGNVLRLRGERYDLMRIELREPAEARIEGRVYDMSAHLIHQSLSGQLAEVVIPLMAGGLPNSALQTVFNNLPLTVGRDFAARAPLNVSALIPPRLGHYLYLGSLTTPPCTEGVTRVVLREPQTISQDQLALFRRLHPENARPLQPSHGRVVLRSNQ
jgi:carbonic anhydrase